MDKEKYLKTINEVIAKGPFKEEWSSLTDMEIPSWFYKAKFGIFIHWGVFSVPAFANEWYSRNMYVEGSREYEHHIKTYGPHKDFGYKDFIPMFKAEKFNPDEWAEIFKDAGAKYIVPVAEHHDGFQMYNSELSEFCAAKMGPKRDVIGELKESFEKKGLVFATSTHRAEHLWFMGCGRSFESDINKEYKVGDFYWPSLATQPDQGDKFSEPYPTEEFLTDWLLRTCEIIDKYQPRILYFDWWIMHDGYKDTLKKIITYYYNRGAEWGTPTAVCYKDDALPFGAGIVDVERGKFANSKPYHWQTDTAIARNTWCYIDDIDYKTPRELVCYLVDVVAKNGNLLLNVGPKSDGTIPETDKHILSEIGKWLKVNGEAIYNTKAYSIAAEGPTEEKEGKFSDEKDKKYTCKDFRFTAANGSIYATCMSYPKDGKLAIESFAFKGMSGFNSIIKNVSILGYKGKVDYEQTDKALVVNGPVIDTEYPVVVKIELG
ncbi:MAG: alpha-L-fucosidase [Lachnospiraceae bacterium]|nr:alpha-L-fucosidase [Lachnospiraceae bacterium]